MDFPRLRPIKLPFVGVRGVGVSASCRLVKEDFAVIVRLRLLFTDEAVEEQCDEPDLEGEEGTLLSHEGDGLGSRSNPPAAA